MINPKNKDAPKESNQLSPLATMLGQIWFLIFGFSVILSIFIAKVSDLFYETTEHINALSSISVLTMTIFALAASSLLLRFKVFRFVFHLASSLCWVPLLECILVTITTPRIPADSFSARHLLFIRQSQWFPTLLFCTAPWMRAYSGDLSHLKNYLIQSSSLLAVISYISTYDGKCSSVEASHMYCRAHGIIPSSSSIHKLYGGRENFVFLAIVVCLLCHTFTVYIHLYLARVLPSIDDIENSSAVDANIKDGQLPDDCNEISYEDAVKLVGRE